MEHKFYPVQKYIKSCQEFADDTTEWDDLDDYRYYETTAYGYNYHGWDESCDGGTGGVDVSWAFHESAEYIDYYAAENMLELLLDELQTSIDEKYDLEQLQSVIDKYK